MNFPTCFKTKLIGIFKLFLLHNIVGCIQSVYKIGSCGTIALMVFGQSSDI